MSEWRAAHAHDARLEIVKAAKKLVTNQGDPAREAECLKDLIEAVKELEKWEQ